MSKLSFEKGVVVWGVGNQPFFIFFFGGGAVFLLISFTVPVFFVFFSEYISEKIENRCFMA